MNHADYVDACTQIAHYLYDEHRSAYGTKGRHYGLWNEQGEIDLTRWTLVQLEMEADRLSVAVAQQMEYEHQMEQAAVREFEKLLEETVTMGAGNQETALRWLVEADEWNRDPGSMEYTYGLPYGWLLENFPSMVEGVKYSNHWARGTIALAA